MKRKINKIREKLHKEMEIKDITQENVVEISEQLDELIVQYYLEEEKRLEGKGFEEKK
ncbi:aspartyl-phosphate phosphatase Spo0E family protein [Tissierella praeacuta]|uniref:aspartyl-phosphate phosphatase Spo0E family protein n=1 Tax=Tissierella praeacuta TaxID=43131 RepID=UPI0033429538